ncbi:competence protein ComFC [Gammaproteobacteria bacterium]
MSYLFPSTCILCGAASNRKLDLCTACENDLPFLKNCCTRCARPLPEGQTVCGACLNNPLPFLIRTFALFYYQTPIKQLMLSLKFNSHLVSAKILGDLLASYLCHQYKNQEEPEVIIPVPLHFTRLRERGYNQALELVRPIAKKLKIPIDKSSTKRIKNTIAQALLPAKKRVQNIKQAFDVNEEEIRHYKHVAVIDDVITTGNTATELCKILYQNGVNKIDVWCVAKAHFQ